MSDFGAIIVFSKANVEGFTDEDKSNIKKALKKVIDDGDYSTLITKGKYLELREWDGDKLCSLLTEYYIDENYDEIFEFTKEEDLEDAESISEQLQQEIGDSFKLTFSFNEW